MQSLSLGTYRVLRKDVKGKEVADTDTFTFNAEFKCPLVRVKINTIQVSASVPWVGVGRGCA